MDRRCNTFHAPVRVGGVHRIRTRDPGEKLQSALIWPRKSVPLVLIQNATLSLTRGVRKTLERP